MPMGLFLAGGLIFGANFLSQTFLRNIVIIESGDGM